MSREPPEDLIHMACDGLEQQVPGRGQGEVEPVARVQHQPPPDFLGDGADRSR
jgi:hypothetical protein